MQIVGTFVSDLQCRSDEAEAVDSMGSELLLQAYPNKHLFCHVAVVCVLVPVLTPRVHLHFVSRHFVSRHFVLCHFVLCHFVSCDDSCALILILILFGSLHVLIIY